MLDRAVHVDGIVVQLELSMRDPGQVEKIVDEERFELDIALKNFQVAADVVASDPARAGAPRWS